MLLIRCPWCGPRDETEFRCGGEAHIARPPDPQALDDAAWAEYLFMRNNPKGWFRERWVHAAGCRRWFNAERHTLTHEIRRTYKRMQKVQEERLVILAKGKEPPAPANKKYEGTKKEMVNLMNEVRLNNARIDQLTAEVADAKAR